MQLKEKCTARSKGRRGKTQLRGVRQQERGAMGRRRAEEPRRRGEGARRWNARGAWTGRTNEGGVGRGTHTRGRASARERASESAASARAGTAGVRSSERQGERASEGHTAAGLGWAGLRTTPLRNPSPLPSPSRTSLRPSPLLLTSSFVAPHPLVSTDLCPLLAVASCGVTFTSHAYAFHVNLEGLKLNLVSLEAIRSFVFIPHSRLEVP